MPNNPDPPKNAPSGLNIDVNTERLDPAVHKMILDIKDDRLAFYCAFSGWRLVQNEEPDEAAAILGSQSTKTIISYILDVDSRILNEAGSNHLFSRYSPLISAPAQTSKVTANVLWDIWFTTIGQTIIALRKNYDLGNSYGLVIERLPDIISMICELYISGSNALEGWKMGKISDIAILNEIRHTGIDTRPQGFLNDIKAKFAH